jgi:hypothetical protein
MVIEQTYLAGKVEILPAFTKAALKADYRPRPSPLEATGSANRQDKSVLLARRQDMFHNFAAKQLLVGDGEAEFGAFVEAAGHDLERLQAEAAA